LQYGYNSQMKKVSISELRKQFSRYLQQVRAGETVLILDRNQPIARIERVADEHPDERLARLSRSGMLTPPKQPVPLGLLRGPAPAGRASVVTALVDERKEGLDVLAP
jgi:prevent-host-death family protein